MKRFWLLIFLYAGIYSQDTVTIMTYNVLHFSGNTTGRAQSIKKVMDYAQPDIVIFEELEHQSGIDLLLSDVFNVDSTAFAAGTLRSSTYMKTGSIYRKSKLDLSSHVVLSTVLRSNIMVWNGNNDGGQLMPAGIYFARMESGTRVLTQKMVLLK